MQEDTIIQRNLFAIHDEPKHPKSPTQIPEDLSTATLKEESQKRQNQKRRKLKNQNIIVKKT